VDHPPSQSVSGSPSEIFHCSHWAAWRSGPSGNVPPCRYDSDGPPS
jgi:hypothetical protein